MSCSCFLWLRTAFYLFCCVVHTNRCNGERVKWKCPGSCSACLPAALVNRTVRSAQRETGGICIHGVVDDTDRLEGWEWDHPFTMCVPKTGGTFWTDSLFLTFCHSMTPIKGRIGRGHGRLEFVYYSVLTVQCIIVKIVRAFVPNRQEHHVLRFYISS